MSCHVNGSSSNRKGAHLSRLFIHEQSASINSFLLAFASPLLTALLKLSYGGQGHDHLAKYPATPFGAPCRTLKSVCSQRLPRFLSGSVNGKFFRCCGGFFISHLGNGAADHGKFGAEVAEHELQGHRVIKEHP